MLGCGLSCDQYCYKTEGIHVDAWVKRYISVSSLELIEAGGTEGYVPQVKANRFKLFIFIH